MGLARFYKQIAETFPVEVDFSNNMATAETISSQSITATDTAGAVATGDVLANPQNDGAQACQVKVLAGTEALSPYKITFKATTSEANVWELDILMMVEEL